ncbi:hypothetical protein Bca4012_066934 [Brassica carinata]
MSLMEILMGNSIKAWGSKDLSDALFGPRSERWSAYVKDGKVKAVNVEEAPSDFKVSGASVVRKFLET